MSDSPVTVGCGVVVGVDAVPVLVQATLRGNPGTPKILGSVDHVVREAYYRVSNAFRAQGLQQPRGAPLLNFAPASVRKAGSCFDLPMAIALAGAGGLVPRDRLRGIAAFGEVALDGRVLPVRGVVPVGLAARDRGWRVLLASPSDASRAAAIPGLDVVPVPTLRDALLWLVGDSSIEPVTGSSERARRLLAAASSPLDLADVRGHETPKTALVVAAAGRHNLLMIGPPGSGKTAMLRRLGGILPPADDDETLDILKIYSVRDAGQQTLAASLTASGRPLRSPHHTSSTASLLGGGPEARPGEVTLAQHGALFLDELPEFRREALEGLRQPVEEGSVTIGRAARTVTLPADFLLVAAMNPCPCGYADDRRRSCTCSPNQRQRYRARVSGPLLDRFDLRVEVPSLEADELRAAPDPAWSTPAQSERIRRAFDRQRERNLHATPNGRLDGADLERVTGTDPAVLDALDEVIRVYQLSARARVRLLRTARTIADLADDDAVTPDHILHAARLRGF